MGKLSDVSGISGAFRISALEYIQLYVCSCRCIPCPFQYDMAVLVRAFVLGFLLFQAFARTIYIRRCDGSFSVYAGLSCVSLFF